MSTYRRHLRQVLLAVLNDLAAAALRTAGPLTSDTWRCGHRTTC